MSFDFLIQLTHRRWALEILAVLQQEDGARFVTLLNRLQLSRGGLSAALKELEKLGLIMKNPGYGHPMRPEYILTPEGALVARRYQAFRDNVESADRPLLLKKWPLPIVAAAGLEPARFVDLGARLPGITHRALALNLKDLQRHKWIERRLVDSYPPIPYYSLSPHIRPIWPQVQILAGHA